MRRNLFGSVHGSFEDDLLRGSRGLDSEFRAFGQ